ncbi:hypothetical protein C8J57DRAFT_1254201 [Mycena rebaudengoi]|nr:hypothetical protein C8J57DRAFT_1254201 [Mycena rebaudengoi]
MEDCAAKRRLQSSQYNEQNREERNRKKRVRMAELRAKQRTLPPLEIARCRAAKQIASQKYRDGHRELLAAKARAAQQQCTEVAAEITDAAKRSAELKSAHRERLESLGIFHHLFVPVE